MEEEDIDEYLYGKETAHAVKAVSSVTKPETIPKAKPFIRDDASTTQQQALTSLYTDLNEEPLRDDISRNESHMVVDNQQEDEDIEIVLEDSLEPQEKQLTSISTSKPGTAPGQSGINSSTGSRTAAKQKDLVIYGVPEYEGQSIFNVDLDTIEDKPWRKPGADITDYFNFGFDEYTWRQYCYKQKMLRDETTKSTRRTDRPAIPSSVSPQQFQSIPIPSTLPPPPPPPHHIMTSGTKEFPPPPPITTKKQPAPQRPQDRQYKPHHQDRQHSRHDSSSRSRSPSRER